ncbi:MAG: PQQ-binding-like beta-propeller repeat protein, partial [Planctomycetota bacterium]|nr:PQQ-binding-like beta-propeller repeat protein [Planctomycetota bacterium]
MTPTRLTFFLVAVAAFLCARSGPAADWPQYRGDAARSGYASESLPVPLALDWLRRARHEPHRAWVGRSLARSRMKFDWTYSVVAAGGLCFVGSSADDKLYALDASTGEEKWSFFTGGPVRLAPCTWQGRVFVGSDDGFLYCLSASDGKLLWKLRAGPNGEKVIGNGRMVSRWVVRGGPAVRDGIVYFGAGIWPIEGVYIYAVDAGSGKVLWCNDSTGTIEIDQPHMVCFARSGVASQGYLAVAQDHVLVTTGRSVPGVFDRQTGSFQHFHLGRYGGKTPWGTGGGDVTVTDDVYFNSGMAFDMATGLRYHSVGARKWWIPFTRDDRKCHGEFRWGERQIVCITPDGFVRSEGKKLSAAKLDRRTYNAGRESATARATPRLPVVEGRKLRNEKHHLERIDNAPYLKDTWSMVLDHEPQSLIVAGKSIIAGASGTVSIIDAEARKVSWSATVDGTVRSLAVSDGRLFASTDQGDIYCFGETNGKDGRMIEPRPKTSPYPGGGVWAKAAEEIVRKTGITKGYCLDIDCRDGALAYELVKRTDLRVVALAPDSDTAESARRKLDKAGVYGVRVAVIEGGITGLPDYFANLIVSSGAIEDGAADQPASESLPVLRPFSGAVCIGKPGEL